MYRIANNGYGVYFVECGIQDGTERWEEHDLEAAIKSLKHAAKWLNGTKLKRKDIEYFEVVPPREVKVQWKKAKMPDRK